MRRLRSAAAWVWGVLTRPAATLSLAFLTLGGFVGGVLFWGAFNTALEVTNTEAFCISCHEMEANVYQEMTRTVHYSNRSGVRASCPDCHVPHEWTDKIARKMQASKEVWGKIFGTINTRRKFLDHRLELAQHEWARLKANDSLECRNCHSSVAMDLSKQTERAATIHCCCPASRLVPRLPEPLERRQRFRASRPRPRPPVGQLEPLQVRPLRRRLPLRPRQRRRQVYPLRRSEPDRLPPNLSIRPPKSLERPLALGHGAIPWRG